MRLKNKVAIITGAGSGIGRASACLFAKEGAKVVVADIDDKNGEDTVNNIISNGNKAIFIHADVSKASDFDNLAKITLSTFGKIDILFNNAGIAYKGVEAENIEESLWDRIYAVNVKSIFLSVKYVVPEMKKNGGGSIINTGSISGLRPRPFSLPYSSSKGAVITLTKGLALELAPNNIRVNCINPVVTDTPMAKELSSGAGNSEQYDRELLKTIPIGRIAKPEDIAYGALYLASDESSMVTGDCLNVDGGRGI